MKAVIPLTEEVVVHQVCIMMIPNINSYRNTQDLVGGNPGSSTEVPLAQNESANGIDFYKEFKRAKESLSALALKSREFKDGINHQEIDIQRFNRCTRMVNGALANPTPSIDFPLTKVNHKDISQDFSPFFYRVKTSSTPSIYHRHKWIISGVSEKIRHARNHPDQPLISPVWCTHRGGYKAQTLLYLNGNGRCLSTHVSAFMVFRSGYDNAFLKWPVHGTMSFFLLDQEWNNARPIVRSLQSDPNSSSFSKPPQPQDHGSEMNVASGCPDFTPISTLYDNKYVKNDTMYWEFSFLPSTF